MPNTQELTSIWDAKIQLANQYHDRWATRFMCNVLEDYYEGFQWEDTELSNYVINLFYSTISTKLPSFIFSNPRFNVEPLPQAVASDSEYAFLSAQNREDALNTWIQGQKAINTDLELACLDSFFRFGILEFNFSANYIDNPAVRRPVHPQDYSRNYYEVKKAPLAQIAENEQIYVRHIPAKQFRVSINDGPALERCDWVGYFEFLRHEDILANPEFNTSEFDRIYNYSFSEPTQSPSEATEDSDATKVYEAAGYSNFCKIWKIWDLRSYTRFVFGEGYKEPLQQEPFVILPLVDLRFKPRTKGGFYPIPLAFNWLHAQNEQNETKEALRAHRRRFKRIYTLLQNGAEPEEVQKGLYGPDGTLIEIRKPDAIQPLPLASMDSSSSISLQISKDDFLIVSGTSAEQLGAADRVTATQARYTESRSQVRESAERIRVANFVTAGAEKVIKIQDTMFSQPMAVSNQDGAVRTVDPITDLGRAEDFLVTVQIESMSPVANDEEKRKFLEFLNLLNTFPQFAMSPTAIRELAYRVGYRNNRMIQELSQLAQLQMVGMVEGAMQQVAANNASQQAVAQQTPPDNEQIRNQLQAQVG